MSIGVIKYVSETLLLWVSIDLLDRRVKKYTEDFTKRSRFWGLYMRKHRH